MKPPKENAPDLIMVEGPDDKGVVVAILNLCGLADRVFVRDEGGYESLCIRLEVELKPGVARQRVGVVVDADLHPDRRWGSIRDRLSHAKYASLPDTPEVAGLVLPAEDLPTVGVWIMPDNTSPGMIEDLVIGLTPTGDQLLEHARATVATIPEKERRFSKDHESKALIHTWLAWQEEPGRPMGQAITKKYLNSDSPQVAAFRAWLGRLFD